MGTENNGMSYVELIGEAAGDVWHTLEEDGPMSVTKLGKKVAAPRDIVLQAIGWLARENKVAIEESGRTKVISLS